MSPRALPADEMRDALLPLRTALRRHTLDEAARIEAEAAAEETAALEAARAEVNRMLERSRERGRRDAMAMAEAQRARGNREARGVALAARNEAYEELLRQVRDRACRLGVREEVVVEDDGTRLVRSLDDLARQSVADLGNAVERLWAP